MGAGLAYAQPAQDELAQRWRSLLANPAVLDRCELNEYGDLIVANPPSKPHQRGLATGSRSEGLHTSGGSDSGAAASRRTAESLGR